jgi:hypothetical protein
MRRSVLAYLALSMALIALWDRWQPLAAWTVVVSVAVLAGAAWYRLRGQRELAGDWCRSVLVLGLGGCCAIALVNPF